MRTFQHLALALTLSWTAAATAGDPPTTASTHAIPISLLVLVPGDNDQVKAFTERLRTVPYLANSGENSNGSNVVVIASVAQVPTLGGSAATATTGLLAASTLGIIPTVENKDICVHYEVRVNYVTVAAFDYRQNFTAVSNIFGKFGKMPDDARKWVEQTADDLARDIQSSQPLIALQAEYDSYFAKR